MRYYEIRVPEGMGTPDGPGALDKPDRPDTPDRAVTLAEQSPFGEYMLYEHGGTWLFAGGAAGRITVTAHGVRADWPGSVSVQSWEGSPFPVMDGMLAAAPAEQWQMFGWASF